MTISASYCLLHRVRLPDRFPVQPRPDMAVHPPLVVGTRNDEVLLCGCEHDGPHLWPDGDEALPEALGQDADGGDS
ncbi:MAG: hypothetical protein DCC58_16730 [Chloroflexi bacterium]|nr:MAG: hypothetical protein DCC58_16730 [Chloroflexota bacterium]